MTVPVPEMDAICQQIITLIAGAIDAEPKENRAAVRLPDGPEVGQQIAIDASEPGGLMNRCRLSILDFELAPAGEAARIEFQHDKKTDAGVRRVYSVQSIRRKEGRLVLLENFLASNSKEVREEDFREIASAKYAQETILKSLQEWVQFRAWQLGGAKR